MLSDKRNVQKEIFTWEKAREFLERIFFFEGISLREEMRKIITQCMEYAIKKGKKC